MKQINLIILLFFAGLPVSLQAQDTLSVADSRVEFVTNEIINVIPDSTAFKPNPTKAMLYSALLPGLGQIYNRKYWKLPFVYGGILGCAYAISWNSTQHSGYKSAYKDFLDDNPAANSWLDYKPYTFDDDPKTWSEQDRTWFANKLRSQKDYFRRYKELSIIISGGLYALCIIDAYVDAQLFDFDISPDLSLRMDPVIFEQTSGSSRAFGLQCSIRF